MNAKLELAQGKVGTTINPVNYKQSRKKAEFEKCYNKEKMAQKKEKFQHTHNWSL